MEILVAWVVAAMIPAFVASAKRRSFLGWFLIGLLLTPLLALIIVLVIGPGDQGNRAQMAASAPYPTTAAAPPVIGVADELRKLAALRDSGVLSADEFERQKAGLLSTPTSQPQLAAPMQGKRPDNEVATCSKCGQFQSPYWRDGCNHCGARYSEFPPTITVKAT